MEVLWFAEGELEIRQRGGGRFLSGSFRYNRTATISDRGRVRKERIGSRAFGWQLRRFAELQEELNEAIAGAFSDAAELRQGVGGSIENAERVSALRQELERRNVHVLSGHDFNKPLGSLLSGTARLTDGDDALRFEVDLPEVSGQPSWMQDTVAQVRGGLAGGISPGFRVPPRTAVSNAEELVPEPGNPGVSIRQINQAVLYEISVVTRPAYAETAIDLRAEDFEPAAPALRAPHRGLPLWV